MIADGSPPAEDASPERSSRSPAKDDSRKKSRTSSSGSSSASEESAASGGSSSESSSDSDSSGSPDRQKKKKKKRRHSSSCVEDAKPDEETFTAEIKDNARASTEKIEPALKGDPESHKSVERSRHRRSQSKSRNRRSRKEHRRRSRDRRRSRSRGRRSRSRERRRRERSRKEGHRRRRSRSGGRRRSASRDRRREGRRRRHRRPRSRSPRRKSTSRPRSRSPASKKRRNEPLSFKEKLKQSFLEVQKQAAEGKLNIDDLDPDKKGLLSMNEKPSALPLNSEKPLAAMAMGAGSVTPQQALLQTMAAMHQKAQELTGVAVPKYYNPAAVNPLKYAEQVQKRKLLWAKKEPKDQEAPQQMSNQWKAVAYAQDGDTKAAEKFRKLMGIKNQGAEEIKPGTSTSEGEKDVHTNELVKKQEELFRNLDKEYEFARMTTHTHRGVGLGFTSHVPYFPK